MKDIEQMRAKFEHEVKLAEIENSYNEQLEPLGYQIRIIGNSFTQKGKLDTTVWCISDKGFTMKNVGVILRMFPQTEYIRIHVGDCNYENIPYILETHRKPTDRGTYLSIEWIHQHLDMGLSIMIDESDEDAMQFFCTDHRRLTESELSSFGIQKTRWNKSYRDAFSYLVFNCGKIVRFQGGYCKQVSKEHALSLVEFLKSRAK